MKHVLWRIIGMVAVLAATSTAQDSGVERFTVPLTNPDRPVQLRVNLNGGSVSIKGGATKVVIVESKVVPDKDEEEGDAENASKRGGLRRIPNRATGLTIEESDNEVSVGSSHYGQGRDLQVVIQVPTATSAKVSLVNGDDIEAEGITGEQEFQCTNGGITMRNIGGSVVANAINGALTVTMNSVTPGKPMSFSSLNGDIDVTFPQDAKAMLSLRADMNGEIYTDFDMKMEPQTTKVDGATRDQKGRYRVSVDRTMRGTINGGGPDFTFKSFQGDIYIRKKK